MATLVKIKDCYLYTTTQKGAATTAQCNAARTLLTNAGIKFNELWYNNTSIDETAPVLQSLSTWNWGPAGSKGQRAFSGFPVLHWTECFDDWSTSQEHAAGISEIAAATILQNVNLVAQG